MISGGSESAGLVCGAFGLTAEPGAALIPVSRGAMGRVWCLDVGAERYAVKELFWESDEESVRTEVAFTAHLESAGIRLPGSLPGRGGRFLQELTPGQGGGWLRLYRWIDGVPVDLAGPGLAAAIGDLAGRLHALARPARGAVDPWYDTVPAPATWDQLADAARGQGAGWAEAMAGQAARQPDTCGLQVRGEGYFQAYRLLVRFLEQLLDGVTLRAQIQAPDPSHRTPRHRDERGSGSCRQPECAADEPGALAAATDHTPRQPAADDRGNPACSGARREHHFCPGQGDRPGIG